VHVQADVLAGAERPTDPGTHQIVARAPGYLPASAEVTLAEGGAESVNLTLTADAAAAPVTETKPAEPPPEQQQPPPAQPADTGPQGSDKTLAYVLWGVGGAGLLTGTTGSTFTGVVVPDAAPRRLALPMAVTAAAPVC
jgi:hypothetical protein